MVTADGRTVEDVLNNLQLRIDELPPELAHRRIFPVAYRRMTRAVAEAIDDARFEDLGWVESFDIVFADLFLAAHDADRQGRAAGVPRPWRLVFDASAELPPQRQLLLGLNAQLNGGLPQCLLAIISDADFEDQAVLRRRRRDFERIETLLAIRMTAEAAALGHRGVTGHAVRAISRFSESRLFRDAQESAWRNTTELHLARLRGADAYRQRMAELELLAAAKITELIAAPRAAGWSPLAEFAVLLPPPQPEHDGTGPSSGVVDSAVLPQQRRSVMAIRRPHRSTR